MALQQVETKQVECLKCGWIGRITKFIPIKLSWCGDCGASGSFLRLYPSPQRTRSGA